MEREEVVRIAREKLGVTSRASTGEYGMLARLLEPGEEIEAMVLAKPAETWILGSGALVVATDRRLVILSKSMITRRERVEQVPRADIRGGRLAAPMGFVLELSTGERGFSMASPASQVAALLSYASGVRSGFAELQALAQRKLGRLLRVGVENELLVLDRLLEADESVLDLAWSAKTRSSTLIVVCPERLILVPTQPVRSLLAPTSIAYRDIERVEADDQTLTIHARAQEHRLEEVLPHEAALVVAARLDARVTGARG